MKFVDLSNPQRVNKDPDQIIEIMSSGNFTQQGHVIKKVQLRLYIEKNDDKLGEYSLITSQVETDRGTIEMIYDEGYRGSNSLDRASKFLTENLGISALILRSIIALDSELEKNNS